MFPKVLLGALAYLLLREEPLVLLRLLHLIQRCQQLAMRHRLQLLLHPE
jgi:hypothetical protein